MAQLNTEHCQVLVRWLHWLMGLWYVADGVRRTSWSWRDCGMKSWRASSYAISSCTFPAFYQGYFPSRLFPQVRRSDAPERGRDVISSHFPRGQQARQ